MVTIKTVESSLIPSYHAETKEFHLQHEDKTLCLAKVCPSDNRVIKISVAILEELIDIDSLSKAASPAQVKGEQVREAIQTTKVYANLTKALVQRKNELSLSYCRILTKGNQQYSSFVGGIIKRTLQELGEETDFFVEI